MLLVWRGAVLVRRAALHPSSETCAGPPPYPCVPGESEMEGRGDIELGSYWTVALGAEVLHAYTICRGKGWWRRRLHLEQREDKSRRGR